MIHNFTFIIDCLHAATFEHLLADYLDYAPEDRAPFDRWETGTLTMLESDIFLVQYANRYDLLTGWAVGFQHLTLHWATADDDDLFAMWWESQDERIEASALRSGVEL